MIDHVNLITTWEDPRQAAGIFGYVNGGTFEAGQDDIDRAMTIREESGA